MDRTHVEEQDEPDKDEQGKDDADPEQHNLPPPLVQPERDKGQNGVADEEPEDEAEEVGIVVDPGQQAGQEEDGGDADELEDGHLRVLEAGPLVDHLHDGGGQQTEVGSSRSNL